MAYLIAPVATAEKQCYKRHSEKNKRNKSDIFFSPFDVSIHVKFAGP